MRRLQRFAAEELVAVALLVFVIGLAVMRADAIAEVFESPYATPAPEGGPARLLVPGTP